MSLLVLMIPPRPRLAAAASDPSGAAGDGIAYVLSPDGLQVGSQGRTQPALLPRADSVVAVLAPADVSWQRVTLPRAPGAKLRSALGGLLEDQLLADDEQLHLALAPGAAAAQPTWVAVVDKGWLRTTLDELERAGRFVDRVVPSLRPGDAPHGHFFAAGGADTAPPALAYADEQGANVLPLQGSLARALLPAAGLQEARWSATPAVAAAAELWLGHPVTVVGEGEHALGCARTTWNLRQFDLAARRRGTRAAGYLARRLLGPSWRPARIGLAGLLLVQVVGMNAWAWQQRAAVAQRRQSQEALLREVFPNVRAVLDAPAQMRRETDQLRTAAGRPGAEDLESMLAAAASAWPDGQAPAQQLRFEPGRLTLTSPGWGEPQLREFRERLRPAGWSVDSTEGRVTVSRGAGAPS